MANRCPPTKRQRHAKETGVESKGPSSAAAESMTQSLGDGDSSVSPSGDVEMSPDKGEEDAEDPDSGGKRSGRGRASAAKAAGAWQGLSARRRSLKCELAAERRSAAKRRAAKNKVSAADGHDSAVSGGAHDSDSDSE